MRYHFKPVRRAAIQKSTINKCWRGCGEKGTLLHCWECKLVQPLWRTVWRFLKNMEIELPYDPAITAGQTHRVNQNWKRHMYLNVHSSTVYNNQDMEATSMSISRWMDKKAVVHMHNGVFSSVQSLSRVWLFAPHELQHTRPPCPSPTPGVHPDSCPSSQLCHPAISSSVVPFSSCLQSFPASESFPMSQFFTSDGQSIGVSVSASVLPMNIQDIDWFDLLADQGTLKSLLQHHSSKASILQQSAFFIVQLSHLYMTTEKNNSFY